MLINHLISHLARVSCFLIVLLFTGCKPLLRPLPPFQPTIVTEASGKQVAKQIVLLTSSSDQAIEKRIKSDPDLEAKMNKILQAHAKRRAVADTLRDVLSWPSKLILWKGNDTEADQPSGAEAELDQELDKVLAADGSIPTNVSVEKYDPKIFWQRSFDNGKLSTLAKLDFGPLNALIYTVAPDDSLYEADKDNLFTDTVVLYAADLDATLNEEEKAIDISDKQQKEIKNGWYALGRLLSPVKLYREAMQVGQAFVFRQDQDSSDGGNYPNSLVFTAFGAYLATAIFVGDEMVSMAKAATGRDITHLSKWIHDRGAKVSQWEVLSKAKNVDRGTQHMTRLGRRAVRLGLAIPIVIGAHIIGRIMAAKVEKGKENPPQDKPK